MLYAFGSNGSGQLGVGHDEDLSAPQQVSFGDGLRSDVKVRQLAAGGNHTLILCEDGGIFATGNNEDGRCGVKNREQINQFTEITAVLQESGESVRIKQISATWSATFLLSNTGKVFTCGSGNSGELGLGDGIVEAPTPQPISDFPPQGTHVIQLASSMAHTVAVLSDGSVYGWGKGRKGQIGEPAQDSWIPRRISEIPFPAVRAACGKDFTYLMTDPASGESMLLGPNGRDRFGIRDQVPSLCANWIDAVASWGSLFVHRAEGKLAAWGRNDHGQLPNQNLPKIEAVAAGSEHCLAITEAAKVLAWGWGEHGNCGEPTENGDVKSRWNTFALDRPARKVFAGCATSFIEIDG